MKLMIALVAVLASLASPVWARTFEMGVVNPVKSQLASYPGSPGQALVMDSFNFTIANGDWVTVDFQGMPQPGQGYESISFFLRETLTNVDVHVWTPSGGCWGNPLCVNSMNYTETTYGLTTGLNYRLEVYGWGDPIESATGSYNLTLTAEGNLAPVPEPETYAMMLAGLGLLGVMTRRRNQKKSA